MPSNPQTLLDVTLNNLSVAGRNTYLHRMVYIGEHILPVQGRENIINIFERNIRQINEEYNDGVLTGFLLAYASLFVHVLEGSEASLLKHAKSFVEDIDKGHGETNEESPFIKKITRTKVITVYHHIHQRELSGWMGAPARPLRTLARVGPEEDPAFHAASCLAKMSRLLQDILSQPAESLRSTLRHLSSRAAEHLPEASLLDFLLGSPLLQSLPEHARLADRFLQRTLFYQGIPVPTAHLHKLCRIALHSAARGFESLLRSRQHFNNTSEATQFHPHVNSVSQQEAVGGPGFDTRTTSPAGAVETHSAAVLSDQANSRSVSSLVSTAAANMHLTPTFILWLSCAEHTWPVPLDLVPYSLFETQ